MMRLINHFPLVLQNPGYLIHQIWLGGDISILPEARVKQIICLLIYSNMEDLYDGDDDLNGQTIIFAVPG